MIVPQVNLRLDAVLDQAKVQTVQLPVQDSLNVQSVEKAHSFQFLTKTIDQDVFCHAAIPVPFVNIPGHPQKKGIE